MHPALTFALIVAGGALVLAFLSAVSGRRDTAAGLIEALALFVLCILPMAAVVAVGLWLVRSLPS